MTPLRAVYVPPDVAAQIGQLPWWARREIRDLIRDLESLAYDNPVALPPDGDDKDPGHIIFGERTCVFYYVANNGERVVARADIV